MGEISFKRRACVAGLLMAPAVGAWAQFRVEVTGVGLTQLPIAVAPFRAGRSMTAVIEEFTETIRKQAQQAASNPPPNEAQVKAEAEKQRLAFEAKKHDDEMQLKREEINLTNEREIRRDRHRFQQHRALRHEAEPIERMQPFGVGRNLTRVAPRDAHVAAIGQQRARQQMHDGFGGETIKAEQRELVSRRKLEPPDAQHLP